jgi:hypothetical protein
MRRIRELAFLLLATTPFFACIEYKASPENGKQLCASTGTKPCPDNYQCVAGVCCKNGVCPGGAGGSAGGSSGATGTAPALQCNPSGMTCAKTGTDVPFCCNSAQCKFTVGAKDFWCNGGDCQAAIQGVQSECTASPPSSGGASGSKGGSTGAGGVTTGSTTRVGGTSATAGKTTSTPTGGTIVITTSSTSPATTCNDSGVVCAPAGATISACCSNTQCKYVAGSREFPCDGTNCQAAADAVTSYCMGSTGTGGTGGSAGAGGIPTGGTTTYPTGGTGGTAGTTCEVTTPCGGDVVGSWTVSSSCLKVSGQVDLSPTGLACKTGEVTRLLKVSGTWTAAANGSYTDRTITSGDVRMVLPSSCLAISGAFVSCETMGIVLQSMGYDTMTCTPATNGGCTCTGTVYQAGGVGIPSPYAESVGTYTTASNLLTTDSLNTYSYCIAGTRMTLSPRSTNPTVTGSISFQKSGSGGSGGTAGTTSYPTAGATATGGATTGLGGAAGATASSDVVTFHNGAASGVMTGYAWIAMGDLDTVIAPTCGLEEAPITSTQPCVAGTNWSPLSQLCVRGTIPALPSAPTAADYDENWGIQIGVNVGPSTDGIETLGRLYSGIAVFATNAPAQGFRILVHRSGDESTRTYCADAASGVVVPFTSFRTSCWDILSGVPLLATDIPNINQVGVQVSSMLSEIALNMCLDGFRFNY